MVIVRTGEKVTLSWSDGSREADLTTDWGARSGASFKSAIAERSRDNALGCRLVKLARISRVAKAESLLVLYDPIAAANRAF